MTSAMANRSEDACRHIRKGRKLDRSICVEVIILCHCMIFLHNSLSDMKGLVLPHSIMVYVIFIASSFSLHLNLLHPQTEAFRVYLHHPAASGCVTKTLTGQWCSAAAMPTLADARVALHRLRGFYFVGIFEQWAATVTAFHTKIASERTRRRSTAENHFSPSSSSSLSSSPAQLSSKPCPVELAHTRERPKGAEAMTHALTQTADDVG